MCCISKIFLCTTFLLIAVGCDESDVVAIRVRMEDHTRGSLVVNSLEVPTQAGPVEAASSGVAWEHRVNLVCASGQFDDVTKLEVEDITFSGGSTGQDSGFLQIRLPTGSAARWPGTVAAAEPKKLNEATKAFAPPRTLKIGKTLKIVVELPGRVVAQGTKPDLQQIKTSLDDLEGAKNRARAADRVATLVVPLEFAREDRGMVVWHLMWHK
jgi:hypothetical protein